jgi:DnaJ-class molecular chaperone
LLRACGAASLRDDVSRTEIQRAYRMLAKRFHPECHPGCSPRESARLAEIFTAITAAYRTLAASGSALQD